ncbi:hypothetical protein EVAR_40475_1 [Eumeta japonica]|uniref:Uncharacterized protein n=1 Tax=Eumeta variegata TaxID=151549 RepID=A0A4C1XYE1_EUMVA|nr:hypothetical protein EVAR_40475_1 [Eumeta japonica]
MRLSILKTDVRPPNVNKKSPGRFSALTSHAMSHSVGGRTSAVPRSPRTSRNSARSTTLGRRRPMSVLWPPSADTKHMTHGTRNAHWRPTAHTSEARRGRGHYARAETAADSAARLCSSDANLVS